MAKSPLTYLVQYFRRPPVADGEPLADAELLRRYTANQDAAAFELLVWRHGPMVLSTCRRITRNDADTEDAFQATFLILARKAHSVRAGTSLAAWLHRTAHRVAVRSLQRRRYESLPHDLPAKPLSSLEGDELIRLDAEINALGERHRRVVVLCYLQGHTTEDAAKLLGIPRGTVLSRLAKARNQLAARLTLPAVLGVSALSLEQVRAALQPTHPTVFLLANGVLNMMIRKQILVALGVMSLVGVTSSGIAIIAQNGGPGTMNKPMAKAPEVAKPPLLEAKKDATEEREKRMTELQKNLQRLDEMIQKYQQEVTDVERHMRGLSDAEVQAKKEMLGKLTLKIYDNKIAMKTIQEKLKIGYKPEVVEVELEREKIALNIHLDMQKELIHDLRENQKVESLASPIQVLRDQIRNLQSEKQMVQSTLFKLRYPEANITSTDKLDQVLAELAELRREVRELKERK
jgi:RNA polymerase sigma factor (sigma-70 family)